MTDQRNGWRRVVWSLGLVLVVTLLHAMKSTGDESLYVESEILKNDLFDEPAYLSDDIESELHEIVEIRRQLNPHGFLNDYLDVQVPEDGSVTIATEAQEQGFLDALRLLEQRGPQFVAGHEAADTKPCNAVSGDLPVTDGLLVDEALAGSPLMELLLKTSQQLDREVHRRDHCGDYDGADRLRNLANQLRIEARYLP